MRRPAHGKGAGRGPSAVGHGSSPRLTPQDSAVRPRSIMGWVDAGMAIVLTDLGKCAESITARNTDTAWIHRPSFPNSYDVGVAGFPGNGEALRAVRGPPQRKWSTRAPITSGYRLDRER